MATATSIRAALLAGLIASWVVPHAVAGAGDMVPSEPPAQTPCAVGAHPMSVDVGKSVVCDFPRDIKDVLVADPKIANAVIRSARRVYIIGNATGATNIIFFDAEGRQMADFDIKVARDVTAISRAIQRLIADPDAHVTVESIGDGIILSGTVASQAESQQAYEIASHFVAAGSDFSASSGGFGSNGGSGGGGGGGGGTSTVVSVGGPSGPSDSAKVLNEIVVRGRDQVMLKVTVAEMNRTVIKQLGINLNGSLGYGTSVVNFNQANPFPVNGALSTANTFNQYGVPVAALPSPFTGIPNSPAGLTGSVKSVTANLQAMEQAGVVRTLAEPTLTAISGESAHFLAGGMFPYPSLSCTGNACQPSIQFQNFGVGLTFTPVVLSEGRISLNMMTEVSELNNQNSVTLSGITVPGLSVRRADTTVEIPSGGTLAIAGMIQEQTKQTISGFPGLMQVPILGTLFKSRDYLNGETELVVLVTPYVVRAVAEKDLSRPDDGFADPSDPSAVLLGRLNRIYGVGGKADPPPQNYYGKYGFILD